MPLRPNPNEDLERVKYAAAQARLPHDKEAWLSLAFYEGEQYSEWSADASTIRRIPRDTKDKRAPRPVVNKIKPFILQQLAFAKQNKPTPDPLPVTEDPVDVSDAEVAHAYCEYVAGPEVMAFDRVLSDAIHWALIAGDCYLKWVWDPKRKRPAVIFVNGFEGYPDPFAKDFRDARYFIHSQFLDPEQVYEMYGTEVDKKQLERQDDTKAQLLRELGHAPVLEGVTVNEMWHRPSRRHPKGLYAVWSARTQLVKPRPLPYPHLRSHDMLPFTQIGALPKPGSQHYDGFVKDGRSPQMELNQYHAQRIKTRQSFASPKWWIDEQLEMEEMPDDSPNQVLKGNSQGGQLKPEILQPSNMADNNEGEWIGAEMMHTFGQHEVSQAQVPGRVEAAKAIELLKEADASRLAELLDTVGYSIAVGYWQILELARKYEKEEVMVQVHSHEGLPEVKRFRAKALKPGIRFRVTQGTGLARSRAARNDYVIRMWETGMLQDPQRAAELMDVPSAVVLSTKAYDVRLARNENYTLAGGQAVEPNSWDDHEVHLREHNNFRKTAEFLQLPEGAKQRFEHHCVTHEEQQMDQLKKMAAKQAAIMPAVGPDGQPLPPSEAGAGEEPQPGQPMQPGETTEQPGPEAAARSEEQQ